MIHQIRKREGLDQWRRQPKVAVVMQGLSQLPPAEAASALAWLAMAGVDTAVDATPRNWLAAAPPPAKAMPPRPSDAPAKANVRPAAIHITTAITAGTLADLDVAVATFAHPLRRADVVPVLMTGNAASGVIIICDQPEPDGSPAAVLRARMLAAICLDPGTCALLHRLPWPTTGSRAPRPDELAAFAPFVARALELSQPRLLLALGQTAAALAGEAMALASARGGWADVVVDGRAVPLLATCHPRLLLAQPLRKREAWADLQAFAMRLDTTP
jgi:DNA polymerase